MKFKKRSIVVEAITVCRMLELMDENYHELPQWVIGGYENKVIIIDDGNQVYINTLEGQMKAQSDDWIIRGVKGELYPCKPDIFNQTYIEVEE